MRFYNEITRSLRRWGIVFLLLVLIAILVFGILFAGQLPLTVRAAQMIPVSLQSHLTADYQSDPSGVEIPVLDIGLIEEAMQDQQPGDEGASEKANEIVGELLTPVPTITVTPIATATQEISSPTAGPSATATDVLPPSATPTATNTLKPSPTNTKSPGGTASITPSARPTKIEQSSPTASATSSATATEPNPPPSSSYTPSATYTASPFPSATPTNTATPRGGVCGSIQINGFEVNRKKVQWTITNNSPETIMLTELYFNWPQTNEKLKKIKLEHWAIWDDGDIYPPTNIISSWRGSAFRREIRAGESESLVFEFDTTAAAFGYFMRVTINDSCMIEIET